jgi:hypothetical protein
MRNRITKSALALLILFSLISFSKNARAATNVPQTPKVSLIGSTAIFQYNGSLKESDFVDFYIYKCTNASFNSCEMLKDVFSDTDTSFVDMLKSGTYAVTVTIINNGTASTESKPVFFTFKSNHKSANGQFIDSEGKNIDSSVEVDGEFLAKLKKFNISANCISNTTVKMYTLESNGKLKYRSSIKIKSGWSDYIPDIPGRRIYGFTYTDKNGKTSPYTFAVIFRSLKYRWCMSTFGSNF